jgi:hypothetical protein
MKRWPYLIILAVLIAGVAASSIHNIPRITPAEAGPPMMQVICSGSTVADGGNDTEPIAEDGYDTSGGSYTATEAYTCGRITVSSTTDFTEIGLRVCDTGGGGNAVFSIWSNDAAADSGSGLPDTKLTEKSVIASSLAACASSDLYLATLDSVLEDKGAADYFICVAEDSSALSVTYDGTGETCDNCFVEGDTGTWSVVADNYVVGATANGCQ